MLGWAWRAGWVAVALLAVAGCASTRVLVRTSSTTASTPSTTAPTTVTAAPGASANEYLARLHGEEQTLAAAERRIPTRATTPQALSRSTSLLAAAVSRLAHGLAGIAPPAAVAGAHARLVTVVRNNAARLQSAAAVARQPGGQARAGHLLVSATNRASAAFSATLSKIYSTLGVRQPLDCPDGSDHAAKPAAGRDRDVARGDGRTAPEARAR
jgi:glutathione S-transferase